jgi:hypothetical protein
MAPKVQGNQAAAAKNTHRIHTPHHLTSPRLHLVQASKLTENTMKSVGLDFPNKLSASQARLALVLLGGAGKQPHSHPRAPTTPVTPMHP